MLTLGDRGLTLNRPALVLEVLEFTQPAAGKERSVSSVKNHTEESAPWEGAVLSLLLPAQPPFVSERNQKPFRSAVTPHRPLWGAMAMVLFLRLYPQHASGLIVCCVVLMHTRMSKIMTLELSCQAHTSQMLSQPSLSQTRHRAQRELTCSGSNA